MSKDAPIVGNIIRQMAQYEPWVRVELIDRLKTVYCHKCGKRLPCECPRPGRPRKTKPAVAGVTKGA